MYFVWSLEILIITAHRIDRTGLWKQEVQDIDIVKFPVGNMNEYGDIASQVEQCVEFYCSLGFAQMCSQEHRKTQVDGTCIERIRGVFQFDFDIFVGIQPSGLCYEHLSKIAIDVPISFFARIGQCAACCVSANSRMKEFWGQCLPASHCVAMAFAIRELRKGHTQKLIVT